VCALAVAWLVAAGPAQAAANRVRFHIPPKPYSEALIDVAVQANISLLGVSACAGDSPAGLTGSYTVEEALRRLLA
jgi:iron complex outermembrane receptor protein